MDMKDKHHKIQSTVNTLTMDKNTKMQSYLEKVFYVKYLWMDVSVQIHMKIITIICRIPIIYKTLFSHIIYC